MTDPAHRLNDDDRSHEAPATEQGRPDWLVSADEGSASEVARKSQDLPDGELRLTTASELSTYSPPVDRPPLPRRGADPEKPAKPAAPVAWAAPTSSVPKLSLVAPAAPAPPVVHEPRPGRTPAGAEAESDPLPMPLSTFDTDADPTAARPAPVRARRVAEPWWVVALDAVQGNLQVQLLLGGVVLLAVALLVFWPRSEPGVSLSALRKDPARWDGQQVRVHGRIGDVFPLGGGYAFYLHQGRDTMVVFTRSRVPVRRKNTEVVGSVSTGFLDGAPRQAIFEEPQAR